MNPANWGTSPTFSFWAKGQTGTTGNLTWALRYLDGTGNILAGTTGQNLNSVNPNSWTQFSTTLAIPTNTVGVFFETTFAIGPVGVVNGTVFTGGGFVIDDISLQSTVTAVPEPESYALLLAGLGVIAYSIRRRRTE